MQESGQTAATPCARPRLRALIRPVRVGATLILLGGPCVLRTTGPSVETVIAPLLQALDGRSSREELLARMPTGARDRAGAFLDDLQACGLLEDGPDEAPPPSDETAGFVRRFSGLAEEPLWASGRGIEARDLELMVEGPSPWREDVIARLAGVGLRGPAGARLKPGRVVASIELGRARAKLIALAGDNEGWALAIDRPSAAPVDAGAPAWVGGLAADLPAAMVAALVEHWLTCVTAAFPTPPSLAGDPLWRARVRRLKAGSRLSWPVVEQGVGAVAAPAWLSEIFRFAVGRQANEGQTRRIAPSAGDLQSCGAVWLARGLAGPETVSAFAYDPRHGQFHRLRAIPEAEIARALGADAPEHVMVLVSSLAGLKLRYGDRAPLLARYDAGVSAYHAGEAARSAGADAIALDPPDGSALLETLGLAATEDQQVGAVLSLRASPDAALAGSAGADPALDAMLRRRSTRRFSSTPITRDRILAIERRILGRLPSPSTVLFRGLRDEQGRVRIHELTATDLEAGAVAVLDRRQFALAVPQAGLSEAPLVYFAGHRRPADPHNPGRQWIAAGRLYSALWLEAVSHGLAGSLCGGVEIADWIRPPSVELEDIALCLGFPASS